MQIGAIDPSSYIYEPYDIPTDSLVIDNSANSEETSNSISGLEAPATAVAINPIPEESIQLQELQEEIITAFADLKEGNISSEEFSSTLEELGVETPQTNGESILSNEQNNQSILDLTSALMESVKVNVEQGSEVPLSSYASIMDIVNQETQSADINEQLQAYTQNLRN